MNLHKREFLTGLGGLAGIGSAMTQGYPKGKDLGAVAPRKRKAVQPHPPAWRGRNQSAPCHSPMP